MPKNGYHDLDLAERNVMRGRPVRKEQDPVRRGIWALSRSLREALNMWNQFVQYDARSGEWETVDEDGVELVRRSFEFTATRVANVIKEIEDWQKRTGKPARRSATAARKPAAKKAKRKGKSGGAKAKAEQAAAS